MIPSTFPVKVLLILLFLAGGSKGFDTCYNISLAPWDYIWIYNYSYSEWENRWEPHDVNIDYYLFDESGSVINSSNANASRVCLNDIDECRYLFFTGGGYFLIRKEQEEVIEWEWAELFYDEPKLIRLGNCQHFCQDYQQLVVVGEADNEPTIYRNNKVVEVGLFDGLFQAESSNGNNKTIEQQNVLTMKTICLKPTFCYQLVGSTLYILSDTARTIVEEGSTYHGYKKFGNEANCHSRCDDKPLLADTRRGQQIMPVVSSISGSELLKNTQSPQYKAACWLIHDDLRKLEATDQNIVQRYVLAVLFYSLRGGGWNRNYDFLTPKHECEWRKWVYDVDLDRYLSAEGYGDGVHCNQHGDVSGILLLSNNLVGTIPFEISWLVHVVNLDLIDNLLSGSIVRELGNLKSLRYVNLGRNALTGPIPQSLGEIKALIHVDLGDNLLSGTIEWKFGANLKACWLLNNVFKGTIPDDVELWRDLRSLSLSSNSFTGTIPNSVLNSSLLFYVNLENNDFNGTIPEKMLSLPRLQKLRLSGNSFTGSIPNHITSESPLEELWLHDNHLTGTIPSELSVFRNLWDLELQNNELRGEIPSNFSRLENLGWLLVQNNNITGIAPFENCTHSPNMEADCDTPQKVSCPCCTGCHGIFTVQNFDGLDCSSGEMKLIFENLESGDEVRFALYGFGIELLAYEELSAEDTTHTYTRCISASGCFKLKIYNDLYKTFDLRVLVNDNVVLDQAITENDSSYSFGYSSNGTMQENICSNFTLCNTVAEVDSAKRELVDKLIQVTGVEAFQGSSSHYEGACMWMNYLDGKTDSEYKQTRLVQYYYLALFYYETNGEEWANSTLWLANNDICSWYGIVCDEYQVVTAIRLASNNIIGSIPTEIAELRGLEYVLLNNNQLFGTIPVEIGLKLNNLKQLDVSNNRLWGFLPPEISLLGALTYLNLSHNQLTGSLSADIGMLRSLQVLDLSRNTFSAELPDSFYDLTALKELSFGSNLFAGDVSGAETFWNLEILNLTNNFFTGNMPLGPHQTKLRVLQLSGNRFRGSISTNIEQLQSLEEVYLHNNELTGSLPSQFGNLRKLMKLSLSYNNIKGNIPSDVGRLRKLTLLHLHNNQLEGNGDVFDYEVPNYITDCGNTFISPARIQCSNCSTCCNVEGDCLGEDITWPGQSIRKQKLSPVAFVFVATLGCCVFVIIFLVIFHLLMDILLFYNSRQGIQASYINLFYCFVGKRNIYVCQRFQQGSVYNFFISNSITAKVLAVAVVAIQVMLLAIFIAASDFSSKENDWQYSFDCPENSTSCENRRNITKIGWCAFACILFCYLIKDILEGIIMVNESIILKYWKGTFAGFVVIYVTVCAAVASTLYNYSTSLSNTDALKDAVILLFLNDIDEKVYLFIEMLYPSWVLHLQQEISDYLNEMKSKLKIRYGDAVSFQSDTGSCEDTVTKVRWIDEEQQNSVLELDFGKAYHELASKVSDLETDHINTKKLHAAENSKITTRHQCDLGELKKEMSEMKKLHNKEISETKKEHNKEVAEMKKEHSREMSEMKKVFEEETGSKNGHIRRLEEEIHTVKKRHETDIERQFTLEKEMCDLKKMLQSLEQMVRDLN